MTKLRVSQLDPGTAEEGDVVTLIDGKWQAAASAGGVLSTVGPGLPPTDDRSIGDLHWNTDDENGYTLVDLSTIVAEEFDLPDGPFGRTVTPSGGMPESSWGPGSIADERLVLGSSSYLGGPLAGHTYKVSYPPFFAPEVVLEFDVVLNETDDRRFLAVCLRASGLTGAGIVYGGQEIDLDFHVDTGIYAMSVWDQDGGGTQHFRPGGNIGGGNFTIPPFTMDPVSGVMTSHVPVKIVSLDTGQLDIWINEVHKYSGIVAYPTDVYEVHMQPRYNPGYGVTLERVQITHPQPPEWRPDYPGGGGGGSGYQYYWVDNETDIGPGGGDFMVGLGFGNEDTITVHVNGVLQRKDVDWSVVSGFGDSVVVPDLREGDWVVVRYVVEVPA